MESKYIPEYKLKMRLSLKMLQVIAPKYSISTTNKTKKILAEEIAIASFHYYVDRYNRIINNR